MVNRFGIRKIAVALTAALALQAGVAVADEVTDKAKALLGANKGAEAYQLLEPLESARAGDRDYDFLLGLAALEAGQNTRAVFALERVLALDPNNTRARAEIARAYLALGETQTAQQEFETVKRQGVPADVSMTIDRYIAAARRIEDQNATLITGYMEASLGYDTNVNVGPNKSSVAIPGFGGLPFKLSSDSKANADWFASAGAGVNVRTPLGDGYQLLAGLSANGRGNFDKQQFDTQNGDFNVGVTRTVGQDVYTVMGQAGVYYVDNGRYRHDGFRPWRLQSLAFKAIRRLQPDYPLWRDFAYEYEHDRLAIDLINGSPLLRDWVDDPAALPDDLDHLARHDETAWSAERAEFLLY